VKVTKRAKSIVKKTMSFTGFDSVVLGPPDGIFLVKQKYQADTSPERLDVGIGAYRDENGKPYVLNVVKKAEKIMMEDKEANKEYLGIAGNALFIKSTQEFCFGEEAQSLAKGVVATAQSLSGTGALRVGSEFLVDQFPGAEIYIPNPTWGNHKAIFTRAGFKVNQYRYFKAATKGLDFEGMVEDISNAPNGSIILLHVCSHNPTGVDPSEAQWQQILEVVQRKKLLPFFDSAYQGFASGSTDKDAYAVRLFEAAGVELLVAQSYSKNMGLYGERIGAINVVCKSVEARKAVESQLKIQIRAMYSNPPRHGASIAAIILSDPELNAEWKAELEQMTVRINDMRVGLRKAIEDLGTPGDWSFITEQIGMFTYTGLAKEQVEEMQKNYHIYMPGSGRISVAGLTKPTLPHLAAAIHSVVQGNKL